MFGERKTATVTTPTTRTKTIALFTFMFFEKEGALLLGKTIQKYAHQLIKTCLTRGHFGNNFRSLSHSKLHCSLFDLLLHHKYKNFGAYTRFWDSIGAIATDLKKRGFKYLGSTLIYSFLQSIGMINGHSTGCWMFEKIGGFFVK